VFADPHALSASICLPALMLEEQRSTEQRITEVKTGGAEHISIYSIESIIKFDYYLAHIETTAKNKGALNGVFHVNENAVLGLCKG